MRFSTTTTGADLGRYVDSLDNLLPKVIEEARDKITKFLEHKNIDTTDGDIKAFLDQFTYNQYLSKYTSMQGQIKAMKENFHYIEPQEMCVGQRVKKKFDT